MAQVTARANMSGGDAIPESPEQRGAPPAPLAARAAMCFWWLALLSVSLDAGWRIQTPGPHGVPLHLYWSDLPMALALACWAWYLLGHPQGSLRPGPLLPLAALVGLAALALLGTPLAAFPDIALGMAGRLLLLLLFYLYTANQPLRPRWLAGALLGGLALQGVVAAGQAVRQSSLGLGFLGERQLDLNWSGISVVETHGRHWLRSYGLAAHPNVLGGFVGASLLPMAVALPRRLSLAAVAGCLLVLLLTLSRGAMLATALGIAVFVLARRRPVALRFSRLLLPALSVLALALVLAATPIGSSFAARFNLGDALEQHSIAERLATQGTAWQIIAAHPLLGVGANNYLAVVGGQLGQVSGTSSDPGYVPVVHNAYLLAAAELGLLGPVLLALALLAPAWLALRGGAPPLTAALAAALAACATVGLVDFYAWSSPGFRLFWVMLLGLWAASRQGQAQAKTAGVWW